MMKKIYVMIVLLLLSNNLLYAEIIKADYDVSYGIFGKIGVSKAILTKKKKRYTIDIRLYATGLAKFLSGDRRERHISKGHIDKNGLLISDLYQVIKSHGETKVTKIYRVNHKKHQVIKTYKKYRNHKLVKTENTTLDFYSKDDLLTLYFNLDGAIKDKNKPAKYVFKAVGAERQQGKVTVIIPIFYKLKSYKEALGKGASWYATAIIHQKIFSSKEGHLLLAVGKDGITEKAVLKDVIFFGDIVAKRVH